MEVGYHGIGSHLDQFTVLHQLDEHWTEHERLAPVLCVRVPGWCTFLGKLYYTNQNLVQQVKIVWKLYPA